MTGSDSSRHAEGRLEPANSRSLALTRDDDMTCPRTLHWPPHDYLPDDIDGEYCDICGGRKPNGG